MHSWFDNPETRGRLPLAYRFVAQYWRLAFLRKPPLRGGSFLLRIATGSAESVTYVTTRN